MAKLPARLATDSRALRIMVVEDDVINATLLAEVLEDMGYIVCAIEATETDAVAAAARCVPDLIVMDATLGDGSGIAAIKTILRSRAIPHLFVSGDLSEVVALCPSAPMLRKPFRISDLALAIERAVTTPALA